MQKHISSTLTLAGLVAGLVACGSPESAGASHSSCLMKYADTPCELLTETVVRSFAPEGADISQSPTISGACNWEWEGGRTQTMTIGTMEISGPTNDIAEILSIDKYDDDPERAKTRFQNQFRTQEISEADKARQEEEARKRAEKIAQERGLTGAAAEAVASAGSRFTTANMRFTPVEGVGDAAAWGGLGKMTQLNVLSGTTKFIVKLTRSDSEEERIQDSAKLAQAIIEACQ